jgi:PIN domain nuclease of toxin-antitoxin system
VILLDTHAWLWWVSDPEQLGKKARRAIEGAQKLGVSAISAFEIAALVAKRRISLDRDVLEWIEQSLADPRLELVSISPAISVRATRLGGSFHGDPADRLIVATAITESATLVTKDRQIQEYAAVQCVW